MRALRSPYMAENQRASGELARFPELQAAGAAFVKTVSVEILERIERGRAQADRTSNLRAERDGDRDFWCRFLERSAHGESWMRHDVHACIVFESRGKLFPEDK